MIYDQLYNMRENEWNCLNCLRGLVSNNCGCYKNIFKFLTCYGICMRNPNLYNSCNPEGKCFFPSYTEYKDVVLLIEEDCISTFMCELPALCCSSCLNLTICLIVKPFDNCCYCMQCCHENCCHISIKKDIEERKTTKL
jgi:hypothetical protein